MKNFFCFARFLYLKFIAINQILTSIFSTYEYKNALFAAASKSINGRFFIDET